MSTEWEEEVFCLLMNKMAKNYLSAFPSFFINLKDLHRVQIFAILLCVFLFFYFYCH